MTDQSFEIRGVEAREVLDSRGRPTIEVDVYAGSQMGREMVPSGASTGSHEAIELRDGGDRYHGFGVQEAVQKVEKEIAPKIIGMDIRDQGRIDRKMIELDGTPDKSNLGANAIMGVSLACARAAALCEDKPFFKKFAEMVDNEDYIIPTPFMNVINGGEHADNNLEFQEHMIVPGGDSFKESLRMDSEIYYELKEKLRRDMGPFQVNVGDEGGFTPNMDKYYEPLDMLVDVIEDLGYEDDVGLALDAAATTFYKHGKYEFDGKRRTAEEMMDIYQDLIDNYPIVSIEDPFHEEDFESFTRFRKKLENRNVNLVGDDLLCTNPELIRKALDKESCTALLLKVNQIGTVTEALEAATLALDNGWDVMVSHRSGETEDHFIADLSVGLSTGQIKAGAPCRGERTAKYNQLLRLEERLGSECEFPGNACIHFCR